MSGATGGRGGEASAGRELIPWAPGAACSSLTQYVAFTGQQARRKRDDGGSGSSSGDDDDDDARAWRSRTEVVTMGGDGEYGVLLRPVSDGAWVPAGVAKLARRTIMDVSTSAFGVGLVTDGGEVFVAGLNDEGQVLPTDDGGGSGGGGGGGGSGGLVTVPTLVEQLATQRGVRVTVGARHVAVLNAAGVPLTHGSNEFGALGHSDERPTLYRVAPRVVRGLPAGEHVVQVACGATHTALLTAGGAVYTLGSGVRGALGHGGREDTKVATRVAALAGVPVAHVAAGDNTTLAVSATGLAYAWGLNKVGQLGLPTSAVPHAALTPARVTALPELVQAVACGDAHTMFLSLSGRVYATGRNSHGQLGVGVPPSVAAGGLDAGAAHLLFTDTPTLVASLAGVRVAEVAAGARHTVFLAADGGWWTCGDGSEGAGGVRLPLPAAPLPPPSLALVPLASGGSTALAVGQYYTPPDAVDAADVRGSCAWAPMRVAALSGIGMFRIAAGGDHTIALRVRAGTVLSAPSGRVPRAAMSFLDAPLAAAIAKDASASENYAPLKAVIRTALGHANCLNGSFLLAPPRAVFAATAAPPAGAGAAGAAPAVAAPAPVADGGEEDDEALSPCSESLRELPVSSAGSGAVVPPAVYLDYSGVDVAGLEVAMTRMLASYNPEVTSAVVAALTSVLDDVEVAASTLTEPDALRCLLALWMLPLLAKPALTVQYMVRLCSTILRLPQASRDTLMRWLEVDMPPALFASRLVAPLQAHLSYHMAAAAGGLFHSVVYRPSSSTLAAVAAVAAAARRASDDAGKGDGGGGSRAGDASGGSFEAARGGGGGGGGSGSGGGGGSGGATAASAAGSGAAAAAAAAASSGGSGRKVASHPPLFGDITHLLGIEYIVRVLRLLYNINERAAAAAQAAVAEPPMPLSPAASVRAAMLAAADASLRVSGGGGGGSGMTVPASVTFLTRAASTTTDLLASTPLGALVPPDAFYSRDVNALPDAILQSDYARWAREGYTRNLAVPIILLCYPFLLDAAAKRRVLHFEAALQMQATASNALARSFYTESPVLVLNVRRAHLMRDTLNTLVSTPPADLKKQLRVVFDGEEGIDAGGPRRELFQLLIRDVFAPTSSYGLFEYHAATRTSWFARAALPGADREYYLVGLLLGLAIYNGVTLDVALPLIVYKKLLGREVTLYDLAAAAPELATGLLRLAEYEGDDVEDVFALTWEGSYEAYGTVVRAELVPGGATLPVTSANRHAYVRAYVDWYANASIAPAFREFQRGFVTVMSGPALTLFRPEELELLIAGTPVLDFDALERAAAYDGGYTAAHPTVRSLWRTLRRFTPEQQRAFLSFLTGCARAPAGGLGALPIKVQRAGPDTDHLPTASVCFHILLLPEYATEDKLAERLGRAIEENAGFGLQ